MNDKYAIFVSTVVNGSSIKYKPCVPCKLTSILDRDVIVYPLKNIWNFIDIYNNYKNVRLFMEVTLKTEGTKCVDTYGLPYRKNVSFETDETVYSLEKIETWEILTGLHDPDYSKPLYFDPKNKLQKFFREINRCSSRFPISLTVFNYFFWNEFDSSQRFEIISSLFDSSCGEPILLDPKYQDFNNYLFVESDFDLAIERILYLAEIYGDYLIDRLNGDKSTSRQFMRFVAGLLQVLDQLIKKERTDIELLLLKQTLYRLFYNFSILLLERAYEELQKDFFQQLKNFEKNHSKYF